MKIKILYLLAVALTTMIVYSCKKETSRENLIDNNSFTASTDSVYLDKVYTTDAVTHDTFTVVTYSYDANKRVTVRSYTENPLAGTFAEKDVYSYNGSDTLPFKAVNSANNFDTTFSFYTYNSLTQRVKDSVIRSSHLTPGIYQTFIVRYTYVTGKIYRETSATGFPVTYDTAIVDPSGNLLSAVMHSSPGTVSTGTFTYDNKMNPYTRLSNYRTLRIFPYGETFIEEMQATNNRLHAVESSGYDEDLTGRYTYKSDNYPSQVIIPDTGGGHDIKVIFKYKSL